MHSILRRRSVQQRKVVLDTGALLSDLNWVVIRVHVRVQLRLQRLLDHPFCGKGRQVMVGISDFGHSGGCKNVAFMSLPGGIGALAYSSCLSVLMAVGDLSAAGTPPTSRYAGT